MITAIQILVQEHRVIESMLLCLERLVDNMQRQKKLDSAYALTIITFLREFADACHHGKEEDVLFKFSDAKTGGHGPVEVLIEEHSQGRGYVGEMIKSLNKAGEGDPHAISVFSDNALDLTDMLRRHIEREDKVVFPMIEELCQSEDAEKLWKDCVAVEKDAGGNRHKEFITSAKSCCNYFNVPFPEKSISELVIQFA
ncbi:hypothetical protein F9K33_03550 [bacterium]|nr:MAG: hypothetical protein F9K33_03550 [bacterium]